MAYRNFTLIDLQQDFGLTVEWNSFFDVKRIKQVMPSAWLMEALKRSKYIGRETAKMLDTYIISPILLEVKINNKKHVDFYFNEMLSEKSVRKLNGKVDFIFLQKVSTLSVALTQLYVINIRPKQTTDEAIAELAAQMISGQLYNKRHKQESRIVYGVMVLNTNWMFLQLSEQTLSVDTDIYHLDNLPAILGIFNHLLKPQPLV